MAWPTTPGSGDLTIDGDMKVDSAGNWLAGNNSNPASGQRVIAIGNTLTAPASLGGMTGGA